MKEEIVVKEFFGIIKAIDEVNHTATVIVSSASIDRDGDLIPPEAFKKRIKEYKAHPILLSSHRYDDLRKQIGKASNVKLTDEGVEVKFEWFVGQGNEEADWGWNLAKKNIAGFSVGFMAYDWIEGEWDAEKKEYKDGIRRKFNDIELVEVSQVLVPSNRDAVMGRRDKADGIEKEMVEMVIKSMDWEKKVVETKPEEKNLSQEIENLHIEIGVLKKQIADLKAIVDLHQVAIEEKETQPDKHFSELLLEQGDKPALAVPTIGDVSSAIKDIVSK